MVPIPKEYCRFYEIWITKRTSMNLKHDSFFVNSSFAALGETNCSKYVCSLSEKIVGLRLSPLDYRHIRATHFFHSVDKDSTLTPVEKVSSVAEYAAAVGQSSDVMINHYVYFNPGDLALRSMKTIEKANAYLLDNN